jgi:hypothetical protein
MNSVKILTKFRMPWFVGIIRLHRCGIGVILIVTELTEKAFDARIFVLSDRRFGARFVYVFVSLSELM